MPVVAPLELTPADLESLEIPDGWGPFLSVDGEGLELRGAVEKPARSIDNVDRGRYVWHHILGVYQLAAWHNHSRYLRG